MNAKKRFRAVLERAEQKEREHFERLRANPMPRGSFTAPLETVRAWRARRAQPRIRKPDPLDDLEPEPASPVNPIPDLPAVLGRTCSTDDDREDA